METMLARGHPRQHGSARERAFAQDLPTVFRVFEHSKTVVSNSSTRFPPKSSSVSRVLLPRLRRDTVRSYLLRSHTNIAVTFSPL